MYRVPAQRTSEARQRCLYCGRENVPGGECFHCLILVPPAEGANLRPNGCARCANPWLEPASLGPDDAIAFACRACSSAFVAAGAWTALVDGVLAGQSVAPPQGNRAAPAAPVDVFPLVRCPVCRYEMERARFGANTTLVIDVCNAHGVWLDPAELPVLVDVLRGGANVPARAAYLAEEAVDPVERALLHELRAAEMSYDDRVGPNGRPEDVAAYFHAVSAARLALDRYLLKKRANSG